MKKYFITKASENWQQNLDRSTKKQWKWYPSNLTLEQKIDESIIYWNTSPTVKLSLGEENTLQTNCEYSVEIEKGFNYDPNLTWFWHKSWVLPEISVNVMCQNWNQTGSELSNIFINLYVVKIAKTGSNFLMTDIGVIGNSELKAKLGKNTFSALKFNSTSFNHSNSKFNILILVHKKQINKPLNCHIIQSYLSPLIFVDSRRKIQKQQTQKSYLECYCLFQPSSFDKTFYKKKTGSSQVISSKLDGFINYFTAPNIRNKIKNPLFLIYKFRQNFIAYYNSTAASSYQALIKLIFQESSKSKLFQYYESENKSTHKPKLIFDKILPKTLICIYVNATDSEEINEFKKIAQKFEIGGENQIVSFVFSQQLVNNKFKRIHNLQMLRVEYQIYYKTMRMPKVIGEEQKQREQYDQDFQIDGDRRTDGQAKVANQQIRQNTQIGSLNNNQLIMMPFLNPTVTYYPININAGFMMGYYNMYM